MAGKRELAKGKVKEKKGTVKAEGKTKNKGKGKEGEGDKGRGGKGKGGKGKGGKGKGGKEKGGKGKGGKGKGKNEKDIQKIHVEQPVQEPLKPPKVHVFQTDLNAPYLASRSQFIITSIPSRDQPLLYSSHVVQKLGKPIEYIFQDNPHPHLIQYMIDIGMMPMEAIHFPKTDNRTQVIKRTGIREIQIDRITATGMLGLATCVIRNHAFVMYVREKSPAHCAGLRFGDEILDINDIFVYKWSNADLKRFLTESLLDEFQMIIRERPFARKCTLKSGNMKDIGFAIHNGRILNVWKDTEAYKKGLLVEHQIIEINNSNVIGMNDTRMRREVKKGHHVILTTMPGTIFDHFMDKMGRETIFRFYDRMLLPV